MITVHRHHCPKLEMQLQLTNDKKKIILTKKSLASTFVVVGKQRDWGEFQDLHH